MSVSIAPGDTVEILVGKRSGSFGVVHAVTDWDVVVKPIGEPTPVAYDLSDLRRVTPTSSPRFARGDLAVVNKPDTTHHRHTVEILDEAPYWPGEPEPGEPERRWKVRCPAASGRHSHNVEWISDERYLVPTASPGPETKPDTYQLTIHLDLTLEQIKALGLGRDALSPFGPRDHETKILMLDVLADTEPHNIHFNRTWIKP